MSIRKYEPRRATAEEARRYFLQYYCDAPDDYCAAPDALFGTIMEREIYLDDGTSGWLDQAMLKRRLRAAA